MAELSDEDRSVDTAPLRPERLSDREWTVIVEIEERLSETRPEPRPEQSRNTANPSDSSSTQGRPYAPSHLAPAENRYQQVLLLDGDRGTGKTSILLTLIERWHDAAGVAKEEAWKFAESDRVHLEQLRATTGRGKNGGRAPENIRVLRNLDFDPLPSAMPLVAGIVQAWRPLAEHYDQHSRRSDDLCDDREHQRLMDHWHKLFRVAALGWTEISTSKGLVEQVLDREEQLRDWQDLREQWTFFVDEVIRVGKCMPRDRLVNPVFVIMIDDVDLQVARIRQLLPALRLLYHPNVFFLVAADSLHMVDMLKLDFLGQQQSLGQHRNADSTSVLELARKDAWATQLADSAFAKVFPLRNRWKLSPLSLSEFLAFPIHFLASANEKPRMAKDDVRVSGESFGASLNQLKRRLSKNKAGSENPCNQKAGDAIRDLADAADGIKLSLPVMSYRSAQQLWSAVKSMGTEPRAAATLAALLSGGSDERAQVVDRSPRRLEHDKGAVNVLATEDLAALYRPAFIEPGGSYDVVLSARPDFAIVQRDKSDVLLYSTSRRKELFTAGLVAKTLQECHFAVDAAGIRWETFSSLAWTEWPDLNALFAWNRLRHPRPDELLKQTDQWKTFLESMREATRKLERFAYAWIYYQVRWNWGEHCVRGLHDPSKAGEEDPEWLWDDLLASRPKAETSGDIQRSEESRRWVESALPLLARPEIGFPPDIQEKILRHVERGWQRDDIRRNLRQQRERLVTDALYARGVQVGRASSIGTHKVNEIISQIDAEYQRLHDLKGPSHFRRLIEAGA